MSVTATTPSRKRKTLHDFFSSVQSPAPPSSTLGSTSISASSPPSCSHDPVLRALATTSSTSSTISRSLKPLQSLPQGLSLHPSFITHAEESTLLTFLSTQPFRTDLSRRTLHYGGTFCLLPPRSASPTTRARIESEIHTAAPLPADFDFLIARFIDLGLFTEKTKPKFCIVNEYMPGQGISAHVENFRFGEPVVALTLQGGDYMRFHELQVADDGSVRSGKAAQAVRTGVRRDVWLERRGLCVMRGAARAMWQHEIVRGREKVKRERLGWRRISLTFRTDVKE